MAVLGYGHHRTPPQWFERVKCFGVGLPETDLFFENRLGNHWGSHKFRYKSTNETHFIHFTENSCFHWSWFQSAGGNIVGPMGRLNSVDLLGETIQHTMGPTVAGRKFGVWSLNPEVDVASSWQCFWQKNRLVAVGSCVGGLDGRHGCLVVRNEFVGWSSQWRVSSGHHVPRQTQSVPIQQLGRAGLQGLTVSGPQAEQNQGQGIIPRGPWLAGSQG